MFWWMVCIFLSQEYNVLCVATLYAGSNLFVIVITKRFPQNFATPLNCRCPQNHATHFRGWVPINTALKMSLQGQLSTKYVVCEYLQARIPHASDPEDNKVKIQRLSTIGYLLWPVKDRVHLGWRDCHA